MKYLSIFKYVYYNFKYIYYNTGKTNNKFIASQ